MKLSKKFLKFGVAIFLIFTLFSQVCTPFIYADEVGKQIVQFEKEKKELDRIDNLLSEPIQLPKDQIDKLVNEYQSLYPNLTTERLYEIVYQSLSPYRSKAGFWDGKVITVDEFAVAFSTIVQTLIGGYATLGAYAAKHGQKLAREMMSRAAKRFGILTGMFSGILETAFNVLDFYENVGLSLAKFIDARDYYPKNGRINMWK
ncbi:hypothetical protein [Enterococcus columbae]|uniref:Uncharacterized protein n=1 Tax=Enterococcus columbae DSM 7374 = ATCC 51263 TaxID=1121865 RepID=S1NUM8_9ENTE|nr:hypothetical protein [Enterococcus columbae]EOT39896.1 hypothetical protein OMW_01685 [Enterococcus columbae DSM 7374 = ATCC 51263]EOW83881.1 hypothetical protein I568_01328 [Enterococcus columbae DSM 7374 = ATCC 51263]OJG19125.1 hypothetical protein RR47_GL001735 [Enterococcus columbae DSM 7374 = ATCC 51263]